MTSMKYNAIVLRLIVESWICGLKILQSGSLRASPQTNYVELAGF